MKRKKRTATKRRSTKTPIFVKISLLIIVLFVFSATIFKVTEIIITNKKDNFPRLEISLRDVTIEQIDVGKKDIKYAGNTATFVIDGASTTYEDVEVKGRGNTTWQKAKKPYQIKFKNKESLFGEEESKKWVLLANSADPTFLRNDIAFYLEHLLNEPYPLSGDFLELYIDDNYRGVYYLTEKVEIDKHRVNLNDPYGVLMELDNIYDGKEGCRHDSDEKQDCFTVKGLVNESNREAALEDFLGTFDALKSAISKKHYDKIEKLIDVDSFAKYYLLSEFSVNPDAYSTSFYMYKNGEDDKIHAGPGWDFDLALGNKEWVTDGVDQEIFHSPFETMALRSFLGNPDAPYTKAISNLIYNLISIPEFATRVKEIYQETLSSKKEELLTYIESRAEYIRPAALRDQERWKLKTNFDEEVEYLIDWIAKRFDHFEQTYGVNSGPINSPAILDQDQELQQPSEE